MASPQLENIGLALQGFSAGVGGQLPQFQQGLAMRQQQDTQAQEKQQAMAIERQKTMFTDASAALQLLDFGDLDSVVKLGVNRLQLLQQFPDANPEDTQRLTQLAVAAKNGSEEAKELLRAELEGTVNMGRALGVLPTPKAAEGATDLGKLKQDLNAGLITQEQYDAASKPESATATTDIGKLTQDFRNGLIDSDQYAEAAAALYEKPDRAAATDAGKLMQDLNAGLISREQFDKGIAALEADEGAKTIAPSARLAAGYAQRITDANAIFDEIGKEFTGFFSRGAGLLPQGFKGEKRQMFDQAARNLVNAILRRESGAAIAESEMENAMLQYIPQPGDSEAVLEQKKRNRETVGAALQLEAGDAYTELGDLLGDATFKPIPAEGYSEGTKATSSSGKTIVVKDGMWVEE